jgi:type VI secretion system Hcp family effector
METSARLPRGRLFLVPLLIALLLLGFLAYTHTRSTPGHARTAATAGAPAGVDASDLLLAAATARTGIFLEWDGVTGGPGLDHSNHAPVASMSLGAQNSATATGTGGGTGKVSFSDIALSRTMDKFSPGLYKAVLDGKHVRNVVLYFAKAAVKGQPVDYLKFEFEDVIMKSDQLGASKTDIPTESLSFTFDKIKMTAQFAGMAGPQTISFDLGSQKAA